MTVPMVLVVVSVVAAGAGGWLRLAAAAPIDHTVGPGPDRSWFERRARVERRVARALPGTLEALARSLRAGLSMRAAIGDAARSAEGPLARDLQAMVVRLDRGDSLNGVLGRWIRERDRVRGVVLAGAAMMLAAEAGGSIARVIDGVADTVRAELAVQAEVRSLAAQAEASALLIAGLPVVFGAVAGLADPATLGFMTSTGIGRLCLVGGVVLDVGGFVWMRRITGRIVT